jgi:hypothetical protein
VAVEAFLTSDKVPCATDDQDWLAGIRRSYGGDRARRCGCAAEDDSGASDTLVRPDDVLTGLRVASPDFTPLDPPNLTRLAQGRLDLESGVIIEPGR